MSPKNTNGENDHHPYNDINSLQDYSNTDNFDKVASNLNVKKNGADYLGAYYFNGKKNMFVLFK